MSALAETAARALVADITPRGPRIAAIIGLVVVVLVGLLLWRVMRPLRGWKRFATRHGLTVTGDRMSGTIDGREVTVELVRDPPPPKTHIVITRPGAAPFTRDALGRVDEAELERALRDAAGTAGLGAGD